MEKNQNVFECLKKLNTSEIMELIVEAKTGGYYVKPMKAIIVYRSFIAIQKFLNEIERVKGSGYSDNCLFDIEIFEDKSRKKFKRQRKNV